MNLKELFNIALSVPSPMRLERDVTIDSVKYHAVVYRSTQNGRDVIGADLRSLKLAPKRKTSNAKEAKPGK